MPLKSEDVIVFEHDVEPIEIATGHFPMAEDPDGLAGLLDRLAAE